MHESQSLGAIARRRLLRDRNAVAGLVVIGIALSVALLGALIRPDPTPWANRQVLEIRDQGPGFRVTFLLRPGSGEATELRLLLRGSDGSPASPVWLHRWTRARDGGV